MTGSELSPVDELAQRLGATWPNISAARRAAEEHLSRLAAELEKGRLVPADSAVIAFGSLARREWTTGSDLDWTLLIDGPVNADDLDVRGIRGLIDELGHKQPGPTGVFGGIASSHDIVLQIGGELDTNRNTTRRILLLLESADVRSSSPVRERVLRALLHRYIGEDLEYRASERKLPRFLLNDIVRYWRTMAVDSAQKRQERPDGWATRNIKLRMSRKLIFCAGLWSCLSAELKPSASLAAASIRDPRGLREALTEHLLGLISKGTPLEILASAFLTYDAIEPARTAMGAYDAFVGILNDERARNELKQLTPDKASESDLFRQAREIAKRFQDGLEKLFFETEPALTTTVQRYGVF